MLAMVVNDDDGNLIPPGALKCIASKLAPTGHHTPLHILRTQVL
jgi:hypothetical protein